MTEYSVTDIMYQMIVQLMTHNLASLYPVIILSGPNIHRSNIKLLVRAKIRSRITLTFGTVVL